ncbi:MAG: hypothetical protein KDB07_09510, partial [Planctomycetes bacterium]|nr:hypothetical protein [Planctomycetota bacterium]
DVLLRGANPGALLDARLAFEDHLEGLRSAEVRHAEQTIASFDLARSGDFYRFAEASVRWTIVDTESVNPTMRGVVKVKAPLPSANGPATLNYSRINEVKGGRSQLHLVGEASGQGALALIEALRDSEGVPLSAKLEELHEVGRYRFAFSFANPPQGATSHETISAIESASIIEHQPIAPNMPPIRQRLGGARVVATQSGRAEALGHWPSAAAARWPTHLLEREVRHAIEGELHITSWDYRFALDALAQAI